MTGSGAPRPIPRRRGSKTRSEFVTLFRKDAARWIRPEQVFPPEQVTVGRAARLLLRHPPLRAMAWFRLGSWAKAVGVRGLPGWCQRRILRLYGLEISSGANIGGGLYVAHPVGTVISVKRMGTNATVIGGATIGRRSVPGWPRIGDRVVIGAGARILGDIELGDGAAVGANAVVLEDVRPNATVVGVPAHELAPRLDEREKRDS